MVCMMGQGDDPLQNRARFLLATASSVEEIVSSMVSLQACSTASPLPLHPTPFWERGPPSRARDERTISSPQLLLRCT